MTFTRLSMAALLLTLSVGACSSDEQDGNPRDYACAPGLSIHCVGVGNCDGSQICRSDGSGYDPCQCQTAGLGGYATTATATRGGSASALVGGSGGTAWTGSNTKVGGNGPGNPLNGGTTANTAGTVANGGATANTAGAVANGGTTAAGGAASTTTCTPADMTGHAYPAYVPARRLGGSCTSADVQSYYSNCYRNGSCFEFQGTGAKAACGACLAPSSANATTYGPLIRFGDSASALDQTNIAGCIELQGEVDCAAKMLVATRCSYDACSSRCPTNDSTGYQALANCMLEARLRTCAALEEAAVCITDSNHANACTASGFEAQFLALGRVFCVENH